MASAVAIDFTSHLSQQALRRERERSAGEFRSGDEHPSTLINLDGGVPSTSSYPVESLSIQFFGPETFPIDPTSRPSSSSGLLSWITNIFAAPNSSMRDVKLGRYSKDSTTEFDIANALNYSPLRGLAPLDKFVHEFAGRMFSPAYADWDTLIDLGAGDALPKVFDVLAEPGDGCLVDEWSYCTSLGQIRSMNIKPIPVQMDAGGLDPVYLEQILSNWDSKVRGCTRPRLLLQVPIGHNPTGITLTAARKNAIYEICVKWDIVLIEDDPYHFMQSGQYVQPDARVSAYAAEVTDKDWVESLVPSFLRYDYQGRVIRLDTFSKTIGPGGRLGFFTTSKFLAHHLLNSQEGRSTEPSGLSQAVIGSILLQWGHDGFIRWLRGLRGNYRMRRDWVLDLLFDRFDVCEEINGGYSVFVAYMKEKKNLMDGATNTNKDYEDHWHQKESVLQEKRELDPSRPLFRFVAPSAGMFLWLEFDLSRHREFDALAKRKSLAEARAVIGNKLFEALLGENVLVRPGILFQSFSDEERDAKGDTRAHMRLSFSRVEYGPLKTAVETLARVVPAFFVS